MELLVISLLNGLSYGLLLFMLSAGLTLVLSLMGVLNFAHAGFYMLGAYFGYSISALLGFFPSLLLAPIAVGGLGALVERHLLRRVHARGHVAELLLTFGLSYLIIELVQLIWGRAAVDVRIPDALDGTLLHVYGYPFSVYRFFMIVVACAMFLAIWLGLTRSRVGLVIQAALTHPDMARALGHDVPRIFMSVFAGGAALAGLAGVIGGAAFVTDPQMAMAIGNIIFVVVIVGGLGSLWGAFWGALLVGVLQTLTVAVDTSFADLAQQLQALLNLNTESLPVALTARLWQTPMSALAPLLPYVVLVVFLVLRPMGLMGRRAG